MSLGRVAAGHPLTAAAAAEALRAGGNAFDAAMAGLCAACVAEPALASLGGGGFLLARRAGQPPELFDFFAQTPMTWRATGDAHVRPILADFGDATQEFHIGLGTIATPGVIAGLFAVQRHLCRLPIADLVAPARRMASDGICLTPFQSDISQVIAPILRATPEALALFADPEHPEQLAPAGAWMRMPDLADAFEGLARAGPDLFYRGEWGQRLARDCAEQGGHLGAQDLSGYAVARRQPLALRYRDAWVYTNPPPSMGGSLIGFALALLDSLPLSEMRRGSYEHIHALAKAQALTQTLRRSRSLDHQALSAVLGPETLRDFMARLDEGPRSVRGTTQISVADAAGNLASLTLSNGEGSGYVLPGTGIMLNNMLGEEDLMPRAGSVWPSNQRIGSMMAPTLLARRDGSWVVTGSSGSNRIRSAVLQVICNLVDFDLDLETAVSAPRLHFEGELLSLEPPVEDAVREPLCAAWPQVRLWSRPSLFFGGAHSVVLFADGGGAAAGDPRRGGATAEV